MSRSRAGTGQIRAVLIPKRGAAGELVELDQAELMPGELPDGEVDVEVLCSSYNYKDGLAIAGRPGVVRRAPLVVGIDVVGRVTASADPRWALGDTVVLNGDGLGEERNGGFADRARLRGASLVCLPSGMTPERAAAVGTAGFTAMIAALKLADAGVRPDHGPIVVTGAAGGLGSIAVALLAGRGYRVVASTGRADTEGDYLRALGAAEIIDRAELGAEPGFGLQSQRWAGGVDALGGTTLANLLAQTSYGGTVVACGLAQGSELPTTVMPFILRGVTLAGANSVAAPTPLRERAWAALAAELDPAVLDRMTTTVGLEEAVALAPRILAGELRGRTVVAIGSRPR